ncbi:dipeptidase [Kibdelosporangium phytohabitans]|uniref:Membrane dipeptidase n=1 Tax=Kibdelosporangium phytohabitans TaxID=860235 RepID=A0A0N9I0P0_9PSEU|nr:dipeptidase [Kibdelosporangium phytohabitans]ALG08016.1 membrane dipeptidase [Kibdelosporangium phytohabitans]MBE1471025.1 membrane dipeptidase [Kibdelosporangium phytohabitans]
MKSAGFDRAVALLSTTQLADGHNDLPWALRQIGGPDPAAAVGSTDLTVVQPGLHTDIPRLRQGGVGLQFWSVYVPCQFDGHSAVTAVLEQIEVVYRLAERYPDELAIATTADEAEAAFRSGRIASMLGAEGGHCIAESLGVLAALRRLGVRYMTLTHNLNTPWADSATDDAVHGGLTHFGRAVVREMNRIGMMVDLSHVAPSTMRDAIETSQAPVVFTHSSCRNVNDHVRNVPDDVLGSLKANGGVCMITFVPSFVSPSLLEWDESVKSSMEAEGLDYRDLDARNKFVEHWNGPAEPQATLDEVVTHLDHAREVAGIDHIGLGGDYDGVTSLPEGLEDVSKYPALLGALLDRGWSEEDCAKLAGRNALRVLRATEEAAERQY